MRVRVLSAGHHADNASISLQDDKRLKDRERCFTPKNWLTEAGGILSILLDVKTTRSNLEEEYEKRNMNGGYIFTDREYGLRESQM